MGNLTVKESGEMVNIISPNVNNITSFKVHFSPKQEGTGDPSPENVREITGWNGVEGYISNVAQSYSSTSNTLTTSIDWTEEVGTVYGGYADLVTGELVATQKLLTITGNEDVTYKVFQDSIYTGSTLFLSDSKEIASPSMSIIGVCSFASTKDGIVNRDYLRKAYSDRGLQFYNVSEYWGLSEVTSEALVNKLQTWNSLGTPLQICYSLADPITIATLSPTQLSTLKGQNNFWSNADYVEIEYELTETFDIQKAKRKIIFNQPHVESTSGTIAKPETDMVGKIKECKIHFMPVQQSDSDPTPDNIVPVTGWTGIDVYSTGKNLFNLNVPVGLPSSTVGANTTNRIFTPYTVIKGTSGTNFYSPGSVNSYSINDNILTVNSRSGYGVGFAIKIKPNQTYTISGSADSEYGAVAISTYSRDGKFTKIREASRFINYPYYSFNTNSQADMLVLTFYAPSGGYNIDIHYSNIQLEIGNTVTNYEPFKGNVISVNWENEIGTMYGGYVDLISGELVQEFKQCKINELSWTYIASGACFVTSKNTPNDILKNRSLLISYIRSDYYTPIDGYGDIATYNNFQDYSISLYAPSDQYRIAIKDSRFTDVSSFLSAMGDTYIWYRLAEPTVTYQLTPQQLTTLRGINNIWSSANGEVEIKYWKH